MPLPGAAFALTSGHDLLPGLYEEHLAQVFLKNSACNTERVAQATESRGATARTSRDEVPELPTAG